VVAIAAVALVHGGRPALASPLAEATPFPTLVGVVLASDTTTAQAQSISGPPAAILVAPTPGQNPVRYTVKAGDTLYSIARAFGMSPSAIQEANGIADPNLVKAGQVLTIPAAVATPLPATQPPTATPPPPTAQSPTASPTPAAATAPPATPTPNPASVSSSAVAPAPPPQGGATSDPMFFQETGFRIANDQFWNYFNRRGGVRTFGYPISKEFLLFGFRVQLFQRAIMQLQPDGSVTTMNLLDDGIMPYTRINFSTFPGPDGGMAAAAPKVGSEGYFDKLLAFVKENSPDSWNGLPTNFFNTFSNTVRYEDAYPDKKQDPGIMPAINLEIWGAPISPPAYDPNNKNFVYLRYQRGIMHYDKTTGVTQGLLLGDYLKSIITGWNLPPDLEEQAKGSRFYRQYNPLAENGLNRPNELPGTSLKGAFARDGLVMLDPGHGGTQIGAAHIFPDGAVLVEKDLNLKVALKTADLLRRAGRQVALTRTTDTQVNNPPRDVTGDGKMTLDDDLQARVDAANSAGADLFLSIHFNGNSNTDMKGAEVYYNSKRTFSDKNKKFAQMVMDNVVAATKAAGFNIVARGAKDDELSVGKGNSLYLLGPTDDWKPRATQMVGALVEGAFLTNDDDAAMLRQEKFQDALATAYAQAIQQYFASVGK